MKILGISGSPRQNSNSQALLEAALAPFEEAGMEARRFLLSEKDVKPCIGCETCVERRACHIRDDMAEVYAAYRDCDAVIIAAPAYWRNVPAQLKALMDRTFAVNGERPLAGKIGGAMAVGRSTGGGGQSIVLNAIHNFYLSCGMLVAPGELNGVTASADKPGDILKQPNRLRQARVLGENIYRHLMGK